MSSCTPRSDDRRMRLVDGLRGIAAFWVVLFHLTAGGHLGKAAEVVPGLDWVCRQGTLGVYIFFVLSGFVIAHSVAKHTVDGRFFVRFAIRRSLRLDPPYWASMVLVLALGALEARLKHQAFHLPSASTVGAHLVYAQTMLGIQPLSLVYWTLCLEIQFYLLFCLLLWLARRIGKPPLLVVLPALVIGAAWPLFGLPSPWPGSWIPFWYGFLAGMLANWAMNKMVHWWVPVVFSAVLLLAALRIWILTGIVTSGLEVASTAAVSLLLLWAGRGQPMRTWLRWRPFQVLGKLSYSIYLIHIEAFTVVYALLRRIVGESALHDWRCALVALAGVLLLSAAFCWLFESPSLRLSQRFSAAQSSNRRRAEGGRTGMQANAPTGDAGARLAPTPSQSRG